MFEVGFTEIVLILGLALLVLGPEKLPGLAQKVGRWTGRARAMARQLRTQLEQEVTMEELARSRPMQPAPPTAETPPPAAATDFTTPEPEHHIHPAAGHSIPAGPVSEPAASTFAENAAIPTKPEQ
jgi:sec-independent protein translocase protein TatB